MVSRHAELKDELRRFKKSKKDNSDIISLLQTSFRCVKGGLLWSDVVNILEELEQPENLYMLMIKNNS